MKNLKLSIKLLGREWRSGELRILLFALVTAVAATTTIGFFTERLNNALVRQSAELIGGDLLLNSSRPLDPQWLAQGQALGLKTSQHIQFSSVVATGDAYILAYIKAVDERYPLSGTLRIADKNYAEEYEAQRGPTPGNIWADPRILTRLGAEVGDSVQLGNSEFLLERVLTFEPDRGGNLFNLAPRVIMHLDDLDKAGVLTLGSRATYTFAYAGNAAEQMSEWLKSRLSAEHQLLDVRSGDAAGNQALQRAEQYLRLTSLLAVLLAAVAIIMATRRYSERHFDVSAMLRCFGAQQRDILVIYCIQLLVIAVAAGFVGSLLGWVVQGILHGVLKEMLATALPVASFTPAVIGYLTGVVILAGTALPPILRLKRVPPLRVLRRALEPLPASAWTVYLFAWLALIALVVLISENVVFTVAVFTGLILIAGILVLLLGFVLKLARRTRSAQANLLVRGLLRLARRSNANAGQVVAFSVTIMLMLVLVLLRTNLLDNWANQLPDNAPNHFAFNILPEDRSAMQAFLAEKGAAQVPLYPMIRGRLTELNGAPLERDPDTGERGAPQRELNLSFAEQLPKDNKIIDGQWWQALGPPADGEARVSLEAEFAERIGASVGDRVAVDIVGSKVEARVVSIRTLNWQAFTPNFYMLFEPGSMDGFPTTYITSFRLPKNDFATLPALIRQFPATTVIEIDVILEQFKIILRQVSLAVEIMLLFVLAAGFAVLFAAIQTSVDERMREGALMRVMGASRQFLRNANLTEFGMLGAVSGLLAVFGAELVSFVIYSRVFEIPYQITPILWITVPTAAAALIGYAGYLATRGTVKERPNLVLRKY